MCVILIYFVIYCAYSDRLEWPACVSGGWWWVSLLKTAQIIRSGSACLVEDFPRFRQSCGLYSCSESEKFSQRWFCALFGAQSQSCLGWNDNVAQAALLRQGHRMMAQNTEWWHKMMAQNTEWWHRLMACAELEGNVRNMDSSSWPCTLHPQNHTLGLRVLDRLCPAGLWMSSQIRLHHNPSGSLWQCLTAWNTRLKTILTFVGLGSYPKNKSTPQFFNIESLFSIVAKPIYYKNIANSHLLFFLEQINIFIKSDSASMRVLQCSGLFALQ